MTGTLKGLGGPGVGLMLVLAVGLSGCGVEPGSGACTETRISAADVTLADPVRPLTLTARLTDREGRPVGGAELAFFVRLRKADGTGPATGVRIGETDTSTSGNATFVRDDGVDGLGFSDERAVGYSVEYNPIVKIHDVQYCRSRTSAALTVR
ncbi:hypothetical protein [Flindersiella endophytica]